MKLYSSSFKNGDPVPTQSTVVGANRSPALSWASVPRETRSLALIMLDDNALKGNRVHWILYNIPSWLDELEEGVPNMARLQSGIMQGLNDFERVGYTGPRMAKGNHVYRFRVFALDVELNLPPESTNAETLARSIKGHVLDFSELKMTYKNTEII